MVFTPLNRPTFLLLEFQHASSLRVYLKDVENSGDINQAKPGPIAIYSNKNRQRFPEQLGLFSNVWKRKSPQSSRLPPDDEQLLIDSYAADGVLRLFSIVKSLTIVHSAQIWFFIDKPTDFSAYLPVP